MNVNFNKFIETEDALFHYTKLSIAVEEILFKRRFKLSLLKNTNDPREYSIKLFTTIDYTPEGISKKEATGSRPK